MRRTGEAHALVFETRCARDKALEGRVDRRGRLVNRFDGRELASRPREDEGPTAVPNPSDNNGATTMAGLRTPLMPKPLRAMMLNVDPSTTSAVHRKEDPPVHR